MIYLKLMTIDPIENIDQVNEQQKLRITPKHAQSCGEINT